MNKFILGIKAKPVLGLWLLFNVMGMIAIVALGGYKIAIYQNPLHLIWFIPTCIILAIISIIYGIRTHKYSGKRHTT